MNGTAIGSSAHLQDDFGNGPELSGISWENTKLKRLYSTANVGAWGLGLEPQIEMFLSEGGDIAWLTDII